MYPERDLNPHSRNGHRILSPACLPFHHPGGIKSLYLKKHVLRVGPCPAQAGIPPSGWKLSSGLAVFWSEDTKAERKCKCKIKNN